MLDLYLTHFDLFPNCINKIGGQRKIQACLTVGLITEKKLPFFVTEVATGEMTSNFSQTVYDNVPDSDGVVAASGGEAGSIRAEGHAPYIAFMAPENSWCGLWLLGVPDSDG